MGSYRQEEKTLILEGLVMVGFPCSSGWLHSHAYMGDSTNWTYWVIKKHKVGRELLDITWKELECGNGVDMIIFNCTTYGIFKTLKKMKDIGKKNQFTFSI